MTAPTMTRAPLRRPITTDLVRGERYRVRTSRGTTAGEFLGIEVPHGDHALLLRSPTGTRSVAFEDIISIRRAR